MEGAVRSGVAAAGEVLAALSDTTRESIGARSTELVGSPT
jgi:hypothetical protein